MKPSGILTLLTDFGMVDHYVAAMKGVVLSRGPSIHIIDVTHDVPPQDVVRGGFVLAEAAPWFPPGTVHVGVVDPGVGTARRALVAQVAEQWIVAPDNGLIAPLVARHGLDGCWALAAPELGLDRRSSTFHGRDLFAPAGALLAAGRIAPADCGPAIEPLLPSVPPPRIGKSIASGTVATADRFGNLVTDLHRDDLPHDGPYRVTVAGADAPWVRTYGEAEEGSIVSLFGSSGWLEVAQVGGSAAATLGLSSGAAVSVAWG
jgi:S-adenosylmethionine hydrolase